ncbi:MAG: VOC family protein [Variovorax sp.]
MTDPSTFAVRPKILRTHLSLFVTDPFASAPWYERVLGMQETARGERWVFMSFGQKHHDIALICAEPGAVVGGVALQHYGLEVAGDFDEFRRLYGRLLKAGIEVIKTTDHKVGYGIYFNDPDGHRFEFFFETVHGDEEGKRVLNEHNAPSSPMVLEPLYD